MDCIVACIGNIKEHGAHNICYENDESKSAEYQEIGG